MESKNTDLLVESIFSNLNTFNQNYDNGLSASNQQFGFDFAKSAVSISVKELDKASVEAAELIKSHQEYLSSDANPLVKESVKPTLERHITMVRKFILADISKCSKNFIQLIQGLNASEFAFGIDLFKKTIEEKFPDFTVEYKNGKVLDNSIREVILNAFKSGLASKEDIIQTSLEQTTESTKFKMK